MYVDSILYVFRLLDSIHFYMSIKPPKKKSKFLNKNVPERLFQKFYDTLDDEQRDYLGNVFENKDFIDFPGENISRNESDTVDETDIELDNNTPSVTEPLKILLHHVSRYFELG